MEPMGLGSRIRYGKNVELMVQTKNLVKVFIARNWCAPFKGLKLVCQFQSLGKLMTFELIGPFGLKDHKNSIAP